ncbi:MAG TPA: 7TM-DISM domain-containing protein [Cytophaga sp.]|nr:7TM-DISM domain-containing protein [Cytophaga sp.]
MNRIVIYLFVQFICISAFAEQTILLNSGQEEYIAEKSEISVFKTKNTQINIDSILAGTDTDFRPLQSFVNDDPDAVYWLKFKLYQNNNVSEKWILEILDSRHYSVELYTINHNGSYFLQTSGIQHPFSKREYLHKNFVFDLRLQEKYPTEFYLKITPQTIGSFIFKYL